MIYYYDFDAEKKIDCWREISRKDGTVTVETSFEAEEGEWILLWDQWRQGAKTEPRILTVNGVNAEEQDGCYVRKQGSRRGMTIHLHAGTNVITAELLPREYKIQDFHMYLIPPREKYSPVHYFKNWSAPAPEELPPPQEIPMDGTWTPGLGRETMPGRFGYSKGDGLLDCAMPWFGTVNKMFLCGHPRYRKPFFWSYSIEQDNAPEADEHVEINQLAVTWRRGETSYSYSLASSGIITERKSGNVRISRLEFACNYQYVLTASEIAAVDDFSGKMPENWLLLFGATEFPEIPLLIVLEQKPGKIVFSRLPDGRLHGIEFQGCRKMTTATPFGFSTLDEKSPADREFLEDAVRRSRFWSRAFLAFPVNCRESFQIDRAHQRVNIIQNFEYRLSRDDWGTRPLKLAPLPPMLSLCGESMPEGAFDFHFPTKFGDLYGFTGSSSAYSVSMMQPRRKFPLLDEKSKIPEILSVGLDKYFDFEAKFPDTLQSYAYPGAILEGYAYDVSMAAFMPEEKRDFLAKKLSERLAMACDPDREYTLLLTNHRLLLTTKPPQEEIYRYYMEPGPERIRMYNIYERVEPYTSQRYNLCYFNVSMMHSGEIKNGSREEVMNYPGVFVENDWGIGITFYMIYSAALFSGDWSAIRTHWDSLKKIFRFFDIFQDWACMGAGYAEKSRTWIEGANFGAFTSFQNMAETLGDQEAEEYCIYLSAKMLALCRGRFFGGEYIARCSGQPAWYGNRFFQEEARPEHIFQYVPPPDVLKVNRVLPCGVSLLTTDAVYPELFESFRETAPQKHRSMMKRYREALLAGLPTRNNVEFSYLIVNDALDEEVPAEQVKANMAVAEETGRFLTDWHDIHRFENNLPPNYLKSQILAWLEMRNHPLWLEHWQSMRVRAAVWKDNHAEIEVVKTESGPGLLYCGLRRKIANFSFSNGKAELEYTQDGKAKFILPGSGVLNIFFS